MRPTHFTSIFRIWFALVPILACASGVIAAQNPALLPWPKTAVVRDGQLKLTATSRIAAGNNTLAGTARLLSDELILLTGLRLEVIAGMPRDGDIALGLDRALKAEEYKIEIGRRATISAGDARGAILATATLLQAIGIGDDGVSLPQLSLGDWPAFEYGGAMLDVARKPHSIETLRQCVRVCRFYKIRFLHLHLTDENAWTFPSTAYPNLGAQNFAWAGGNRPEVYKLPELKELVEYADARGVTLVPEIEMPGHSGQLRGSLPRIFGYTDAAGKPLPVGVINMTSEEAFKAIDTIIGEVCDVFRSSPFIHTGSDEASLGGLELSPEVAAFMKANKLASSSDVFNAFVNRVHQIVKRRGKRMIVWEGAPFEPVRPDRELIVMPWVGGGGTAAEFVRLGYPVINPPWGIKGHDFDPYLVNGAQFKRGEPKLIGATSISWQSPQEAAVPFLRYTGAHRNEATHHPDAVRGYADFLERLQKTDSMLDRLLCGFTMQPNGAIDPRVYLRSDVAFEKTLTLTLESALQADQIHYTLDGTEPEPTSPAYSGPIVLRDTSTLKARWFGDRAQDKLSTLVRIYRKVPAVTHDAIGVQVTVHPKSQGYPGPGAKGLADGFLADGDESGSAGWIGWEAGENVQVMLDLGKSVRITSLGGHFLRAAGGIEMPMEVELAVSVDGKTYQSVAQVNRNAGMSQRGWFIANIAPTMARHVLLTAKHSGAWIFMDEIVVNPARQSPPPRHAALASAVTMAFPPAEVYSAPGVGGLTDGYTARSAEFLNPYWLGVEGKNFDATVDLGKVIDVSEVSVHFLQSLEAGIYVPVTMDIFISDDGKEFRKAGSVRTPGTSEARFMKWVGQQFTGVRARFVRVVGHTNGLWLFADEIVVNPEKP